MRILCKIECIDAKSHFFLTTSKHRKKMDTSSYYNSKEIRKAVHQSFNNWSITWISFNTEMIVRFLFMQIMQL